MSITIGKFTERTGIKFTEHKNTKKSNSKLNGIMSVSTSPTCNGLCIRRTADAKMICSKCYSMTMNKRFKNLREQLETNSRILTGSIIPMEDMPMLHSDTMCFRFEAFGDLINEMQVVNYFNMASANPWVNCALWTKNPWIIEKAMKEYGITKPNNLKIIGSSYYINKPMTDYYKKFGFVDNVFTVYDLDYVIEHKIDITCGGRSCQDCECKCYKGTHDSYEINELLK